MTVVPILSCIMPTADRRCFVPQAIAAFLAQGRDDAELLILDDGTDAVADLIPADPRIRYVREEVRRVVGVKRNRLCEMARGEVIVHWDDDDWHAPDRLDRQLQTLNETGADVCGLDRVVFLRDDGGAAWDYVYGGREPWVYGASLCYRKDVWRAHRFPEIRVGEDTRFVFAARGARVHAMADNSILVARVHGGNTSPKRTAGAYWRERDPRGVQALLERAPVGAQPALAPQRPIANVHACLVHERPDCVIDLVRNLRRLDPISPILLYDGGPRGDLLDPALPWDRWGVERVAHPRPMRWGALHGFALDCIDHLKGRDYETMTIIDSDQLALRAGYGKFLAQRLGDRSNLGLLSSNPAVQGPDTRIAPARTAQAERALWRPFLRRFEDGEAKFAHWSFWPSTVIFRQAGEVMRALFDDPELQAILAASKLWATEEVLFPTLAALLGFRVAANPCRQTWVQYRKPYGARDVAAALSASDAFWLHPAPRRLEDPVRKAVRDHHQGYRDPGPSRSPAGPLPSQVWPLLKIMRGIEGWLADEEGELMILAARAALAEPGAVGRLVEVGAFCGKASFLLASEVCAAGGQARLTVIDPFDGVVGARDQALKRLGPTLERFERMVAEQNLGDWIEMRIGSALDANWSGPIDLLLIDGLHDYAAVAADFAPFADHLRPGARVLFHDYADYFPGVVAFVDDLVAAGGWVEEAQSGSLKLLRRLAIEEDQGVST